MDGGCCCDFSRHRTAVATHDSPARRCAPYIHQDHHTTSARVAFTGLARVSWSIKQAVELAEAVHPTLCAANHISKLAHRHDARCSVATERQHIGFVAGDHEVRVGSHRAAQQKIIERIG